MKFSVDAHAIGRQLTGNEVYVRNLITNFAALDTDSEFIAYLSASNVNGWVPGRFERRMVSKNPFCRLGYDLSRNLLRDRPDLLHVQYTAPLECPVPVVVSVHDVSFVEHPEYFQFTRRRQLCWTVRRTVQTAAKIVTGSEFSRAAIARVYGVNGDDIAVVPNAASPIFRPIAPEVASARVLARFGMAAPFLLTVGDLQPRKNQIGLIQAFGEAVRSTPGIAHDLLIVGKDTWFGPQVRAAARESGAADRIHFTGFVSDEELLDLYNACDVFVFPSFYEGFGLPVLEAMACGRAVACSDTSAIPEVADSAAILFDPYSKAETTRALLDLLLDRELRLRMGKLGLSRAQQFNWRKAAAQTLEVYNSVAERREALVAGPRKVVAALR
jgi:glycosyltransferase involved in cell wall biosynthesis